MPAISATVVSCTITSNGKAIPAEYGLLYIDTTNEFNRIPHAELGFLDGDPATQKFDISDSDFFEPGRKLEIKLRYENEPQSEETVFKGIVVKQALQVGTAGSVLVVEAFHEVLKMTSARGSAKFEDVTDSDVVNKLLTKHGVQKGVMEASAVTHKQLVQYQVTDWDFILSRAEANGLLLALNNNGVSLVAPKTSGTPKLKLKFGIGEVYGFEVEADARQQFAAVESSGWDIKKQNLTSPAKAVDVTLSPGNLQPDRVGKALGNEKEMLLSAVGMDDKEANAWAKGRMMKNRLSFIKGRVSVQGTAQAVTGDVIQLEGFGRRFSGSVLVSGVRHRVSDGSWVTDIQFGLSADPFLTTPNVVDSKAAGLLPGVNGLQVGVVDKYAEDPEKENRIKVVMPALNKGNNGYVWSRLASLDAGKDRGGVFWPEPGDEVVLGFLNDDPRQAIVLGSVYSSANTPPLPPADKNPQKGFVTKGGLKLTFDDEKKLVSILTSDKNTITINDKDKIIEIKDINNNSIKLNQDGITIESAGDVVIKAKRNLNFQTDGNVKIKGQKIDIT